MKTRGVLIAAVAAGVLGIVAGVALQPSRFAGSPLARLADRSPTAESAAVPAIRSLVLRDVDDNSRELRALIGQRPALVNLWATWCAPCLKEMPALDEFDRREGPDGVQVIGIALDEAEAVRRFLRQRPVGYPILVERAGPDDAAARLGNTRGVLPYSLLVAADGRILRRWAGPLEPSDLQSLAAEAKRTHD